MPTISFLVFVHNESKELEKLMSILTPWLLSHANDELVIVDDFSTDVDTRHLLDKIESSQASGNVRIYQHGLNGDFSSHKNFGNRLCKNDFIFQIDADEYPTTSLLENVKSLISMNPTVELFWIPRVNIVRGLTAQYANMCRWKVYSLPEYPDLPIVNWEHDHQGRIYKNEPDRIQWMQPVHERIAGHKTEAALPCDPDFALIHDKELSRQMKQNEFYSTLIKK